MNTKEMIAVMQAYEDGKRIEGKLLADPDWYDIEKPLWDWDSFVYRIKATKKPVQLSVLIDSGIDCEFMNEHGTKVSIGKLVAFQDKPKQYMGDTGSIMPINAEHCRPRLNHIHAWQGGDCPLPFNTMVRIHYRDYVRANESYVKRAGLCYWEHRKEPHGLDIIAFEVIGLADGYCYPWECE